MKVLLQLMPIDRVLKKIGGISWEQWLGFQERWYLKDLIQVTDKPYAPYIYIYKQHATCTAVAIMWLCI